MVSVVIFFPFYSAFISSHDRWKYIKFIANIREAVPSADDATEQISRLYATSRWS